MTSAEDRMAADAKWVINACVARGYEVGIATAGCRSDFVKRYLAKRVDPDVFTPQLLASAAFQSCLPDKTQSLPPIMAQYGLADAHGCGVLFDQGFNRHMAERVGVGFADVDIRTGLRASDFAAAEAQYERNCPMSGQQQQVTAAAAGSKA